MQLLDRFIPPRRVSTASPEELAPCLGSKLQTFFDGLTTSSPMPDRLAQLAQDLEAALERGELGEAARRR